MEHNAHEYTECPKCGDTVLDLNMLYDADGSTVLHCTNCAWEMGEYDSHLWCGNCTAELSPEEAEDSAYCPDCNFDRDEKMPPDA
jgi:NADH pyrophosphatase NudC (nudix superfamily)